MRTNLEVERCPPARDVGDPPSNDRTSRGSESDNDVDESEKEDDERGKGARWGGGREKETLTLDRAPGLQDLLGPR